jgi:hypothetical protein
MNESSPYRAPSFADQPSLPPEFEMALKGLQIITVILMAGPVVFMGVALAVNQGELGVTPDVLSWVAIGVTVVELSLYLIVPDLVARQQRDMIELGRSNTAIELDSFKQLLPVYRIRHIVACALLEGAIFLNVIAYLVSKFAGNLAAAVFLLVIIALKWPTGEKIAVWLNNARSQNDFN